MFQYVKREEFEEYKDDVEHAFITLVTALDKFSQHLVITTGSIQNTNDTLESHTELLKDIRDTVKKLEFPQHPKLGRGES